MNCKNQVLSPYRILIIVDSVQRDLPGHILLKRILEEKYQTEVKLCSMMNSKIEALLFRPHAVIIPVINNDIFRRLAYYYKSHDITVIYLPSEGYANVVDEDFLDLAAGRYNDSRPVDLACFWNQEYAERSLKHRVLPEERVYVVGTPRFDYYHPSFSSLRPSKKELCQAHSLDPNLPTITWVSSFPAIWLNKETHRAGLKQTNASMVKVFSDVETYLGNEHKTFQLTIDALTRWFSNNKNVNFIIRPHPHDNLDYFKQFQNKLRDMGVQNVALIPEGPIWDILSGTDIMIQRGCTTAIEGALFDIPVIELRLNKGELFKKIERDKWLAVCCTYELFDQTIKKYLQHPQVSEDQLEGRKQYIEKWFYKTDGRRTVAMADLIYSFLTKEGREPYFTSRDFLFGLIAKGVSRLKGMIYRPGKIRNKKTYFHKHYENHWKKKIDESGILQELMANERKPF